MRKWIFILIVFPLLLANSVGADDANIIIKPFSFPCEQEGISVNGECYHTSNSSFTSLKPSYQIVPIINRDVINPGENFSINFQVVGGGKVESNFITIYFPPNFLSEKNDSFFSPLLAQMNKNNKTTMVWFNEIPIKMRPISNDVIIISFVNATFMELDPNFRAIFGEVTSNRHPPLLFEGVSSENAFRGDNRIKIIFRYSDGKEWYSSKEEITIHVNNPIEENRQIFFIASAILGIILTCISIEDKFQKIISSWYGKIIVVIVFVLTVIILDYIYLSFVK